MPIRIYKNVETPFFHFHNANPKGRNASDCVYRAISVALDLPYEDVMRDMTEFALEKGYAPDEDKLIRLYMESKGWVTCKEPRNHENKKITVERFIKIIAPKETLVVKAGSHHITLIKEGKVWDTWDSSKQTMHSYWRKKQ